MILQTQAGVTLDLRPGTADLEAYNVELVRGYIEKHPDCMMKHIEMDLGLHRRTVEKALRKLGAKQVFEIGFARRR
ncbi:hypothetical protein [Bradyrhizobium neotropicale]|uniref:hypothetical protein n=1 Tax=Bradyrhizobium neotropicale TaxID=1497615 RepID=UPI001AD781B3|nr:hypothetical protein [Bradyrhizobium neotropicale]MBO4228052.1 hypothetical protein [Bradyrhizobium neotropicale]